jgi:hypothetical protein
VLLEALAALAAADSRAEVAAAALPLLIEEPGVRACAVVGRDGDRVVVLGSAGYDCGTMGPGAVLPLDAGLPVTEAVRTGRLVERGHGPAWVAVPFGGSRRAGALLLSLTAPPPSAPEDLARLHRLARALGDALRRAAAQERTFQDLALLTTSLAVPGCTTGSDVVVRSRPHEGPAGGDAAVCVPDGAGGRWLLVADVCGSGLSAAVVARTVHTAATAVAPFVSTPVDLLRAVERAVLPETGPGSFVTALACHVQGTRLRAASAGHPAPVLLDGGVARVLPVEPGQPLALETGAAADPDTVELDLPVGAVLLLHTDGLTDRRTADGTRSVDAAVLLQGALPHDLQELADHALWAADCHGPVADDVTVLVLRVGG